MSKTFSIIYKNYDLVEISSEKTLPKNIIEAIKIMFKDSAYYQFNASLDGDNLHIRTKYKDEFSDLCERYVRGIKESEIVKKYISLNLDV